MRSNRKKEDNSKDYLYSLKKIKRIKLTSFRDNFLSSFPSYKNKIKINCRSRKASHDTFKANRTKEGVWTFF
jgi:hypothetical protein